jgi:hypothetical protein
MALKSKILTGMMAISLSTLIITGSFAWASLSSQKINEWRGIGNNTENNIGGTLHDDHDNNDYQKDVYVENWGDEEIYVRIRLSEYMEIGSGAGLRSVSTDPFTGDFVPNPQNSAKSLISGADINKLNTWKIHTLKDDATPDEFVSDVDFHSFWEWDTSGQKYYYPTSESNRKIAGYVDQNSPKGLNANSVNDEGVQAKITPRTRISTMNEWKAGGSQIDNVWVIDLDGWAYWAAPVRSGEATGLLLHSVTLKKKPAKDYYYAINVVAQMATKDDTMENGVKDNYERFGDIEHGGWTLDGQMLMEKLVKAKLYMFNYFCETGGRIPIGIDLSTSGMYEAGSEIKLFASALPGYVFDTWVASDERAVFDNAHIAKATFIMPECDVIVTATFKPKSE